MLLKLIPYKMGIEDFIEAVSSGAGIKLEENTRKKLEKKEVGELEGLKQIILEKGLIVEQEKLLTLGC